MENKKKAEVVVTVEVADMAEVTKKEEGPSGTSVQEREAARVAKWLEEGCREPQVLVRTLPGASGVRQVRIGLILSTT